MRDGNDTQERGRGGRTTRRAVLKSGAVAGLASAMPWAARRARAVEEAPTKLTDPGDVLSTFENELPNPLAEAFVMNSSGNKYDVSLVNTTHVFDPAGMNVEAPVFAYKDNEDTIGGTVPGKTFEVWSGESATVRYTNELFGGHFLPIDTTVHGASAVDDTSPRTVTHMHGGKTQPPSDGEPEDTRRPGNPQGMHYSNINPASTLWYHDHALGITRLNVYAGLAGFYIVRDEDEAALDLPSGPYEIPIVLQDRCFDTEGNLLYPYEGEDVDGNPIGTDDDPRVPLEFFGNVSVVNGVVWPTATVEPRTYRIRLLNGSNSRFYNLELQNRRGNKTPDIYQIGTDGGFLFDGPLHVSGRRHSRGPSRDSRLLLAPGERLDLLVDFSGFDEGTEFLLHNNAGSPFKGGNTVRDSEEDALPEILTFVVGSGTPDGSGIPDSLPESFPGLADLSAAEAVNTRHLTLVEGTEEVPVAGGGGGTVERLQPRLGVIPAGLAEGERPISAFETEGLRWDDPNTEDPKVNQTEVWELYNLTEDTHPIHLHIVQFKLLDRQAIAIDRDAGTVEIDSAGLPATAGEPQDPDPTERGPKDTVRANPGEVTRIVVPFDTFPGETVWHCHILEHEDNEMMRPMKVGGTST